MSLRGLVLNIPTLGGVSGGIPEIQTYKEKVQAQSPYAYWPLDEESGSTATDASANSHDGTYTNVALADDTFVNGDPAALFVAANNPRVDVSAAPFATNASQGAVSLWFKASSSSIWTDGVQRALINFQNNTEANKQLWQLVKESVDNRLRIFYRPGGAGKAVNRDWTPPGDAPPTGWTHVLVNYGDNSSGLGYGIEMFIDGVSVGSTAAFAETWSQVVEISLIGMKGLTFNEWDGYIAHVALFSTPRTPAQIAELASA